MTDDHEQQLMKALTRIAAEALDEWPKRTGFVYFIDERFIRIADRGRIGKVALSKNTMGSTMGSNDMVRLTEEQQVKVMLAWVDDKSNPGTTKNITKDMWMFMRCKIEGENSG